jgi:uncharacterized 2Fe-2S/4Fe-4S cluster protein (DUF4445 family)
LRTGKIDGAWKNGRELVVSEFQVVFQPAGKRGSVPDGITVLDAARMLGVGIEAICGGRQTCAKCRISVADGQFAKYALTSAPEHVSPVEQSEADYRTARQIRPDERLACVARVCGDVVINVPPEAQAQKQIVRKSAGQRVIHVDPAVKQVYVEVPPAEIGDRRSDWDRLAAALAEQWHLEVLTLDSALIPMLGKVLRAGNWRVTVTLRHERDVIRIRPGYGEGIIGLAVDLGTTTIAAYLCDLRTGEILATETAMNPQIAYGEDLMSRVSYGMMNADGVERMHRAVIRTLNDLAARAAKSAGLTAEEIIDLVIVGNPIMHHLFLGIDPVELGGAPFALTVRESLEIRARDLGLRVHPGAAVHTLPLLAGHVGADSMAVALAEAPHKADRLTLIVDVGTNAEILLGDSRRVLAASSPTGPAFEGAQIKHGQRAAPGAIERVRIDPATLEPRYKVIGHEAWSDESQDGSLDLHPTGITGSGIIEAIAEMFLAGIIGADGRFTDREHPRIVREDRKVAYILADESANGGTITVTQDDVRAIQLAKAALYAGVRLLMDHHAAEFGVQPIERIVLAGAFGSYIDPKYAMILGLIPDCDPDNVVAVGNAAGDGARIALLNESARAEAQHIMHSIQYIETATDPGFQAAFVDAIHIPHKSDVFPHLAGILPVPNAGSAKPRRRVVSGK